MLTTDKMEYRYLGNSGLRVSVISFGNMINFKPQNDQIDKNIIKACLDNGINFFDTAEMYQFGKCQSILGKHLKELGVKRQHIVVSTKILTGQDPDINSTRKTSRKHIKEGLSKSLERLQLEYVDIVFAHIFDPQTPLQEICRSFHQVIEQGKAFYWGTSNWRSEQVFEAFAICEKLNLHKPIAAQNQYNMIVRNEIESEYRTLFEKYNYGTTHWSPLAGGYLTGKYLDGISNEGSHRLNSERAEIFKKIFYDPYRTNPDFTQNLKALKEYSEKQIGCPLHNLALAWALKFKYTSTAIIGARSVQQLQDNIKALQVMKKLTPQVEGKINKLLGNHPPKRINWILGGKPWDPLRPQA